MNAFIQACLKANQEIYEYITTHISSQDYEYTNIIGEGGDNSLAMDLKAESIFVKHLLPFGSIYSEESGEILSTQNSGFLIVIDPLDGSDNFLSGLPYYGTSVALKHNDQVINAAVCNLVSGELIYKIEESDVQFAHIFNLSYQHKAYTHDKIALFERAYKYPNICQKLFDKGIKFRSPGAVALSLANAQCYDFVLFLGTMRSFDLDAALHICSTLNVYQSPEILLVSKNSKKFEIIKELLI